MKTKGVMKRFTVTTLFCIAVAMTNAQSFARFQIEVLAGAIDHKIAAVDHQEAGFTDFHMSPSLQLHTSRRFSKRWAAGIHQAYTTFKKTYTYNSELRETFHGGRYVLQGTISFFYLAKERHQLYSGLRVGQHWNLGKKDPGSTLFKGGTSEGNVQLVLAGYRTLIWKNLGFLLEIAVGTPTAVNAGISLAIP